MGVGTFYSMTELSQNGNFRFSECDMQQKHIQRIGGVSFGGSSEVKLDVVWLFLVEGIYEAATAITISLFRKHLRAVSIFLQGCSPQLSKIIFKHRHPEYNNNGVPTPTQTAARNSSPLWNICRQLVEISIIHCFIVALRYAVQLIFSLCDLCSYVGIFLYCIFPYCIFLYCIFLYCIFLYCIFLYGIMATCRLLGLTLFCVLRERAVRKLVTIRRI